MPRSERNYSYRRPSHGSHRDSRKIPDIEVRSKSVVLRGMDPSTNEDRIRGYLRDFGNIESITLLCDKDKKSRGVAYVEFSTTDESADFIRRHIRGKQSLIHMDGKLVEITNRTKQEPLRPDDWVCPKCKVVNFRRRAECYGCGVPIEEPTPTETLMVTNLNTKTPKSAIVDYFSKYAPVRGCKFDDKRDDCAYVRFFTIKEAEKVLRLLKIPILDKAHITISFAPTSVVVELDGERSRNNRRESRNTPTRSYDYTREASMSNPPSVFNIDVPDKKDFYYDEGKKGFFNPRTNLYFDSESGYFYDIAIDAYFYFDAEKSLYIRYGSNETRQPSNFQPVPTSYVDAANAILQQVQANLLPMQNIVNEQPTEPPKPEIVQNPTSVASFDDDIDGVAIDDADGEDVSEIISKLKEKYEIPNGTICMLCKRNLTTSEKLVLHFQRSSLHAENLAKEAQSILTGESVVVGVKRTSPSPKIESSAKRVRYV